MNCVDQSATQVHAFITEKIFKKREILNYATTKRVIKLNKSPKSEPKKITKRKRIHSSSSHIKIQSLNDVDQSVTQVHVFITKISYKNRRNSYLTSNERTNQKSPKQGGKRSPKKKKKGVEE